MDRKKENIIIIVVFLLICIGVGIGIYFVMDKKSIDTTETYNIVNYTDKSIWRVNTILKPGEERVSPNGLVKIYVKVVPDRLNNKMISLWRKNPNKFGKFNYGPDFPEIDMSDMQLFSLIIGSNSGINLTSTGTDPGGDFNIQTVTTNNKTYHVTFDGDATKGGIFKPVYFNDDGIPQGKLTMGENTSLSSFMLNTNDIDYILVRNDAILIFDKNNKLLGVFG